MTRLVGLESEKIRRGQGAIDLLIGIDDAHMHTRARFSKIPKLFGWIAGDIILFVSSQRRRLETRNFAAILIIGRVWQNEKRKVRVNDVAVVADSNAVCGKWSIGRVSLDQKVTCVTSR